MDKTAKHTPGKTLSPVSAAILNDMRQSYESTITGNDGRKWGAVYLDNVCPSGMTRHQFAGHLSALEAAGVYRRLSAKCFGDVLLEDD